MNSSRRMSAGLILIPLLMTLGTSIFAQSDGSETGEEVEESADDTSGANGDEDATASGEEGADDPTEEPAANEKPAAASEHAQEDEEPATTAASSASAQPQKGIRVGLGAGWVPSTRECILSTSESAISTPTTSVTARRASCSNGHWRFAKRPPARMIQGSLHRCRTSVVYSRTRANSQRRFRITSALSH